VVRNCAPDAVPLGALDTVGHLVVIVRIAPILSEYFIPNFVIDSVLMVFLFFLFICRVHRNHLLMFMLLVIDPVIMNLKLSLLERDNSLSTRIEWHKTLKIFMMLMRVLVFINAK
jgi:hypothetical protein